MQLELSVSLLFMGMGSFLLNELPFRGCGILNSPEERQYQQLVLPQWYCYDSCDLEQGWEAQWVTSTSCCGVMY